MSGFQCSPSSPSSCQTWLFFFSFQDKFMCPPWKGGERTRIQVWIFVLSHKLSLAALEIRQSKLATAGLWMCCQRLSLVKPVRSSSGWSACSLLLLTCSFSTSQQHCKFLCLRHVCSAASSLGSSHSDPSGFSLSTATFHIPFRDRDGTLRHKSLLHKSQGSLRPAIREPSLAFSPHTAIVFCL